ncbi:MAG: GNAT family N-acetyltransferase [Chloroflexota bacterium]
MLRVLWGSAGFDPSRDVYLVFNPLGELAGYTEVWALSSPPVHPFIWGVVDRRFQGLGIGTHTLAWAEQHARRVLDLSPADVRVAATASFPSVVTGSRQLLEHQGWRYLRRSYTMQIDLDAAPPAPVFPPGLVLQPYQPEHLEAIYRTLDESFSDHFGHIDQPFEIGFPRFKHEMLEDPLVDTGLWFTAWDGEQAAGICLCRPQAYNDPDCGYVNFLGVRRAWRKRGLGLALLQHTFGEFYRRGVRKVSLGVDAYNLTGALRLYEKAGMYVLRQFDQYEKELRPGRELRVE